MTDMISISLRLCVVGCKPILQKGKRAAQLGCCSGVVGGEMQGNKRGVLQA